MKHLFINVPKGNFKKAGVVTTVFSLKDPKGFLSMILKNLRLIVTFSSGLSDVSSRLRHFHKFFLLIIRTFNHHGETFTVKWLKSCHMAVQRCCVGQPFRSLRAIEPDLPLPRLINGLPFFIGTMDRAAIRRGHAPTIRMWLSILNVYRVIDAPINPKLETITAPYQGSEAYIDVIAHGIYTSLGVWRTTTDYFSHLAVERLSAADLRLSTAAGPNIKYSFMGPLVDAIGIWRNLPLRNRFIKYLEVTKSPLLKLFVSTTNAVQELHRRPERLSLLHYPKVITEYERIRHNKVVPISQVGQWDDIHCGKLVGLPEPAGKLRIIAIVDVWTQSALKPLHDQLFQLLRKIPNDGTFDQNASVTDSINKARAANCAFSVDLSSATDRLPIRLQSEILNLLFGHQIGDLWRGILDRPFVSRTGLAGLKPGECVYYGTGQPMGCLSSWAMLAVTHHLIVQHCCLVVGLGPGWHTCYAILGDDLVIFDKQVYLKYLEVMSNLDVGTNPSKSLVSESAASFEFAKRTVINGSDVSGLSWRQFITGRGLSGFIQTVISLGIRGLIWRDGLLERLIVSMKDPSHPIISKRKLSSDSATFGMVSLLSYFAREGLIGVEDAIAYVLDPSYKGGVLTKFKLPVKHTVHDIVTLFLSVFNHSNEIPHIDLLTVPSLKERKELGAKFVFDQVGRDIYSRTDLAVLEYNEWVYSLADTVMEVLIPDYRVISSVPWEERPEWMYKLDNLLRQLAGSLLRDPSPSLESEIVDFNQETDGLPPLPAIIKFNELVQMEIEKYRFMARLGRPIEKPSFSIPDLLNALHKAESRMAAPKVLDPIEGDSSHGPFVGQWDVMIPKGWKGTSDGTRT
jgi:hypothetical protein